MAENVFPNFALHNSTVQDFVPLESIAPSGAATLRRRPSPCVHGGSSIGIRMEVATRRAKVRTHTNPKVENLSGPPARACAAVRHQKPNEGRVLSESSTAPPREVLVAAIVVGNMFCSGETITKFCVDLLVDTATPTTIRQFDRYGELRWSGMTEQPESTASRRRGVLGSTQS